MYKRQAYDWDDSKLIIYAGAMGGEELHQELLGHYHLQMEMVSADYVLGMTSLMDTDEGMRRLVTALHEIDEKNLRMAEPHETAEENRKTELDGEVPVSYTHLDVYKRQQLYKGDYNISEHQDVLDAFKENTGLDVTLSWNTTRMATSLVRQDGSRETGTEIAADVYQTVKEKGSYFVSDNVIDGQKYYGYYEGLYNSDGSMAGLVFTGMASTSVHEIYNDRLKKNIIFMVVLAIFACIFLAIVMMKIVKAMMSMIDHLDDVAEGNLDSKISDRMTSRSDEIGNIARALYSLIGGLAMIVKNIRTSAKSLDDFSARFQNSFTTINESIHNVNTAMEDIANGATNQAGEMQKVNEQISDMNEAIAETTKNVENLTGSTEEMKEQNHKLDGTIKDLVEISDRTRESVDEVNRQTDRTNQSVMEIGSACLLYTSRCV